MGDGVYKLTKGEHSLEKPLSAEEVNKAIAKNWKVEIVQAATPDATDAGEPVSQMRAGQLGLEQGASLGTSDEMVGVGAKLAESLPAPWIDVPEGGDEIPRSPETASSYEQARDVERGEIAKAQKAWPKTFLASEMTAGMAPAMAAGPLARGAGSAMGLTSKLSPVARASSAATHAAKPIGQRMMSGGLQGAGIGGIEGALMSGGTSEAETAGGVASDMMSGGMGGMMLGGGMGAGLEAAMSVARPVGSAIHRKLTDPQRSPGLAQSLQMAEEAGVQPMPVGFKGGLSAGPEMQGVFDRLKTSDPKRKWGTDQAAAEAAEDVTRAIETRRKNVTGAIESKQQAYYKSGAGKREVSTEPLLNDALELLNKEMVDGGAMPGGKGKQVLSWADDLIRETRGDRALGARKAAEASEEAGKTIAARPGAGPQPLGTKAERALAVEPGKYRAVEMNAEKLEELIGNLSDMAKESSGARAEGLAKRYEALAAKARGLRKAQFKGLDDIQENAEAALQNLDDRLDRVGIQGGRGGIDPQELSSDWTGVYDALRRYGAEGQLPSDQALEELLSTSKPLLKRVRKVAGTREYENLLSRGSGPRVVAGQGGAPSVYLNIGEAILMRGAGIKNLGAGASRRAGAAAGAVEGDVKQEDIDTAKAVFGVMER